MRTVYLRGAYDRSYINSEDAKRDWLAGLDFRIITGPYCSIRDVDALLCVGPICFEIGNAFVTYEDLLNA